MSKATGVLLVVLAAVAVLAALPHAPVRAQAPQQAYEVGWWTVDGGGRMDPQGGGYSLGGAAGQPDAGLLSGGGYELGGGFWGGGAPAAGERFKIYLPLVIKS